MGPMGWSADLPAGPTDLPFFFIGLFSGSTCQRVVSWLLSRWFSSLVGPPIHVMPEWQYLIGRYLLLGQKEYDCTLFSSKTCTHRNLEGHMKFGNLLVAWASIYYGNIDVQKWSLVSVNNGTEHLGHLYVTRVSWRRIDPDSGLLRCCTQAHHVRATVQVSRELPTWPIWIY